MYFHQIFYQSETLKTVFFAYFIFYFQILFFLIALIKIKALKKNAKTM